MSYAILERKNVVLDYKKRELKKSKRVDFSKRVSPWFLSKIVTFSILLFQAK